MNTISAEGTAGRSAIDCPTAAKTGTTSNWSTRGWTATTPNTRPPCGWVIPRHDVSMTDVHGEAAAGRRPAGGDLARLHGAGHRRPALRGIPSAEPNRSSTSRSSANSPPWTSPPRPARLGPNSAAPAPSPNPATATTLPPPARAPPNRVVADEPGAGGAPRESHPAEPEAAPKPAPAEPQGEPTPGGGGGAGNTGRRRERGRSGRRKQWWWQQRGRGCQERRNRPSGLTLVVWVSQIRDQVHPRLHRWRWGAWNPDGTHPWQRKTRSNSRVR